MSTPSFSDVNVIGLSEAQALPVEQRGQRLDELLRQAQETARLAGEPFSKARAERVVEKLEHAIESNKVNLKAHRERMAAQAVDDRERDERAEAKRQAIADDEKQSARTVYLASNPTATNAEFESVWPELRDRKRAERAERALATARRAYHI